MSSHPSASVPRPASTVVILRDGVDGLEVLLTIRPQTMRFMGGAAVFPGGAVAPADTDPRWVDASVLSAQDAAAALDESDPSIALGYYVCALREALEEVAFSPAHPPSARVADPEDFLHRHLDQGVKLATDALVPAGRWVTPLGAPVRFDARFFLAPAPPGWEPDPDPSEVAEARWVTPAEALAELGRGETLMAPPTVEMLHRLAHHGSVGAALEEAPVVEAGGILSTRLSPLVHLVLAPNPGLMTGPGTNTYVVGPGSGRTIVIDPAVDDPAYLDAVAAAAGSIAAIVITHRHEDHVGGAAVLAGRSGAPVRAWGDARAGEAEVQALAEGERLTLDGATLRVMHTPGHASDHVCLLLEGAASLFAGDCVLGEGTAVIAPPDGDMAAYMSTLERLADLSLDRIYPGHFRPLDGGRRVIEGYISHRLEREAAIESALRNGARSVEEVVAAAYVDTPTELHPIAALSARAHLDKLEAEGRVVSDGISWRLGGTR